VQRRQSQPVHLHKESHALIPASPICDQSPLAALLDHDPVVTASRSFFSQRDWSLVTPWEAPQSTRGRPAHPQTASLKAFLIRVCEGVISTSPLRSFLLTHPVLVIALGVPLVLDVNTPEGFDVEKTLPTRQWLCDQLRCLDRTLLTDLRACTVHAFQEEIPGLGDVVSFEVKHLSTWVTENHPRVSLEERFDPTRKHPGDPDCTRGVTRRTTQEHADGTTKEKKADLWGSGSGVAAAPTPDAGDVVRAACTHPFTRHALPFFTTLHHHASLARTRFPPHIAADAASDAWSVSDAAARQGGSAALPRNQHGHPDPHRGPDGTPFGEQGVPMIPRFFSRHPSGSRAQRCGCPLIFPTPTRHWCPHLTRQDGQGCHNDPNGEPGGLQRLMRDRSGPLSRAVSNQRTACERITSQAKEVGIERPNVRHGRSVANLTPLISVVLTVRPLERATSINRGVLSMQKGFRYMHSLHPSNELL
jgi:hypothetical protein